MWECRTYGILVHNFFQISRLYTSMFESVVQTYEPITTIIGSPYKKSIIFFVNQKSNLQVNLTYNPKNTKIGPFVVRHLLFGRFFVRALFHQ